MLEVEPHTAWTLWPPEVDKQNVHEDEKTLSSTYRKPRDGEMKVFIEPWLVLNVNMKQVTASQAAFHFPWSSVSSNHQKGPKRSPAELMSFRLDSGRNSCNIFTTFSTL